ncbi:uncharacterized protein PFL1_01904 [Pseudozyma flocculosa PF-1]|uniref:Uncharacterized protein n=1 Tax=Pseudozyma flocculosa TaxID=84751 RepID=A0A5C3F2C1_9BASI|nr:uncharacterized protein PFL1_01904 [Pseudozyma flocculosa PF-1]EPQ30378.1 hypothetical protein PFL1_01904 [Pseudozyma flocculosa PF-1]SPO37451.1 uncharacterized protein PSFLO_02925 [Pseudozyma flocculosa]
MSYLPPVDRLRLHASHPSTRLRTDPSSSYPSSHPSASSSSASSSAHTAQKQARLHLLSTRRSHLAPLPPSASRAALTRSLHGYPPLYSTAEADQLSDLEESLDVLKDTLVRFGDRHIVQIGRRRTLHEEEMSDDEDARRPSASFHHGAADDVESDSPHLLVGGAGRGAIPNGRIHGHADDDDHEGGGGDVEYGDPRALAIDPEGAPATVTTRHTGHAAAEAARRQMEAAERRIREAEAEATRAAAVANAARSTAQRQAAFQLEQDAVDLDADVEDLDDDGDDVDYD